MRPTSLNSEERREDSSLGRGHLGAVAALPGFVLTLICAELLGFRSTLGLKQQRAQCLDCWE